jgi:hypothetical protein
MNSRCQVWKSSIFGELILSASCVVASACGVSPADESRSNAEVSVHDGRLTFRDMQAFADTVQELNEVSPGSAATDYLENRLPGFQALGAPDNESAALPPLLRAILDQNHSYQVADQIYLIYGGMEYIIPASQAQLVASLRAGVSATPYVAAGTIRASQPQHITPETLPSTSPSLLDAKYQFEFTSTSHTYKIVDESYVDIFSTFTTTCFRSKMEYRKGNDWKAAGETVYKHITNPEVRYNYSTSTSVQSASIFLPSIDQTDGNNLTLCYNIPVGPSGTCIQNIQLFATYDSIVSSGPGEIIGLRYVAPAEWGSEYVSLSNCR